MSTPGGNTLGNILIVEDDADFSKTIEDVLTQSGYRPIRVGKVAEAMAKLRNQKFDCILLDLKLQGGSGESILNSIRANIKEMNHSTPVIIMSGFLEKEIVTRSAKMVSAILVKPFNAQTILEKIRAAMAK